jgi:hypothetical protein
MLNCVFLGLTVICLAGSARGQAPVAPLMPTQTARADSGVVTTDKPVYLPGDTLLLVIQRNKKLSGARITPVVAIDGMTLTEAGQDAYAAVIPPDVGTGSYRIFLKIVDADGRRSVYETGRSVDVEERQAVEDLVRFVSIVPAAGGDELQNAVTLDRQEVRDLQVVFRRDAIRQWMGPQFVTIRTTVQSSDGIVSQMFERRVLTFRSHGDPVRDREAFVQYRTAYGAYAAISTTELEHVGLRVDSLPGWAIIKVNIEPDYTIRIGAYNRLNSVTRYFRVKGPTTEIGFSLGIPKVLYDTQAADSIEYGNTSAMLRWYHLNSESGRRFPVSLGVGTFGVRSPIDVGVGRGGFALSMFLDLVEMLRIVDVGPIKKVTAGLEVTPFFPLERRARLLVNAQVGFSL